MRFSFLYEVGLYTLSLLALPKLCYQMIVHKKYRTSLSARFGSQTYLENKKAKFLIWIHAVSVGESKAVAPVARLCKTKFPDSIIIVSSGTETGHAEAKKKHSFC